MTLAQKFAMYFEAANAVDSGNRELARSILALTENANATLEDFERLLNRADETTAKNAP